MSTRMLGVLVLSLWAGAGGTAPQPAQAEDAQFSLCAEVPYRTCVHNGDLIYLRGQPIRLSDIVAPDRYAADCPAASNIAWYAAIRLRDLLNQGPYDLIEDPRRDAAADGTLVRRIERDGMSLGDTLVEEGLARRWSAAGTNWCGPDH